MRTVIAALELTVGDVPIDRLRLLVDALEVEMFIPELILVSVEAREWPDTSMGCPTPDASTTRSSCLATPWC